jgi:hypothetical protein
VLASAAAATASSPSRPIKARSVVIITICPSWVSAIGTASFSVSANSTARRPRGLAAAPCGAGFSFSRTVIGRD